MIKVTGVAAFQKALDAFVKKAIPRMVERRAYETAIVLYQRLRELTPVRTGTARDGWTVEVKGAGFLRRIVISNRVPYVIYLELGTDRMRPYAMVARTLAELAAGALLRGRQ